MDANMCFGRPSHLPPRDPPFASQRLASGVPRLEELIRHREAHSWVPTNLGTYLPTVQSTCYLPYLPGGCWHLKRGPATNKGISRAAGLRDQGIKIIAVGCIGWMSWMIWVSDCFWYKRLSRILPFSFSFSFLGEFFSWNFP